MIGPAYHFIPGSVVMSPPIQSPLFVRAWALIRQTSPCVSHELWAGPVIGSPSMGRLSLGQRSV